jgi:hypothetical protein
MSNYAKNYGQNTPLYHLTPGKSCNLSPYIRSANCSDIHGCNRFSCQNYYDMGRPIGFEYTLAGLDCPNNNEVPMFPSGTIGAGRRCTAKVPYGGI